MLITPLVKGHIVRCQSPLLFLTGQMSQGSIIKCEVEALANFGFCLE